MANFEWFTKAHRYVYDRTQGWLGGYLGRPMVLIYSVGARTGQIRPVPLQAYPILPEGVLVLASNNGQTKAPSWYYNLKAYPDIDIRLGRRKLRVHAEELEPGRRSEVWPLMRKQNPAIETYARKSGRAIPVMLLRRA